MTAPKDRDFARGWKYLEKLLAEEDAENEVARIEKLGDDELFAELRQRGTDPSKIPTAEEFIARGKARAERRAAEAGGAAPEAIAVREAPPPLTPAAQRMAPVIPIRRPWATALGLLVATFFIVCIFKMSIGPDPVATAPTDRQIAEGDRDLALASCALKEWAACKRYLDEAARLDPKGESEPRVVTARGEIANAAAAEAGVAPR